MWFALTKFIANLDNFKKFQNVFADCKWNYNIVFSDFLLFDYRISNFIILGNSLQDNIMGFLLNYEKLSNLILQHSYKTKLICFPWSSFVVFF